MSVLNYSAQHEPHLPTYNEAIAQDNSNHRLPAYCSSHVRRYHPYPRRAPPRLVDFYFNTIYDDERIELDLRLLGINPPITTLIEDTDPIRADATALAAQRRIEETNARILRLSDLIVDFVDGVKNGFAEMSADHT